MHFFKTTEKKRTLMLSVLAMFSFVTFAQDQLASVAPIDKRMRAIDSISIAKMLEKAGVARRKNNYHFREWIFARQRYWGEPVPCVYTEDGKTVFLPDEELPVVLPVLEEINPKAVEHISETAELLALDEDFLEEHRDACIRLPMRQVARSLNLSNSVAITVYEALRQLDFPHLQDYGKMRV